MITTLTEWEKFEHKNSLTCLRGMRDKMAESVILDASSFLGDKAVELVEEMITLQSYYDSYHKIRIRFLERQMNHAAEYLAVFHRICFRIAKLERQFCGMYIGSDLQNA